MASLRKEGSVSDTSEGFLEKFDLDTSLKARSRTLTEKGKEYRIELLSQSLKKQLKVFQDSLKNIQKTLDFENPNPHDCEKFTVDIEEGKHAITKVVDSLCSLTGPCIEPSIGTLLEDIGSDSDRLLNEIRNRFSYSKELIAKSITSSAKLGSVCSKKSSNKSARSSVASMRVKAEVEAVAASVELNYFDREADLQLKQQLEKAKQDAERKKLELQKQHDLAQAKLEVFNRLGSQSSVLGQKLDVELSPKAKVEAFVNAHVSSGEQITPFSVVPKVSALDRIKVPSEDVHMSLPKPELAPEPVTISQNLGSILYSQPVMSTAPSKVTINKNTPTIHSTPFKDISKISEAQINESCANANSLADITRTMCDQLILNRLPIIEPSIFDGTNPLDFPTWKIAFDTLIHSKSIPSNERLHYLNRYLSGEAKEAVQGFFMLSSDEAYSKSYALLVKRYGDHFRLASAFRSRLKSWPKVDSNNSIALRKFVDFLKQCETAMTSLRGLAILNDEAENSEILRKLPSWLVRRWTRKVADYRQATDSFPTFTEFVQFLSHEEDIANDPVALVYKTENVKGNKGSSSHKARSLAVETKNKSGEKQSNEGSRKCYFCKEQHLLDVCPSFGSNSIDDRKDFVRKNNLCFGCFGRKHISKDCKSRKTCSVCKRSHPTSMHNNSQVENCEPSQPAISSATHLNRSSSCSKSSMILPVYVSHVKNPSKERLVYALLDTQSDTSFVLKDTHEALGVPGTDVTLLLSTMVSENKQVKSKRVTGLVVRGYNSNLKISLPTVYSRDIMPVNRDHIPSSAMIAKWPHLERIKDELTPLMDCEVGLLIGYNCAKALIPREVVAPVDEGPFAQRTDLGWGIVGVIEVNSDVADGLGFSHRILARTSDNSSVQFTVRNRLKEVFTTRDCLEILETDFREQGSGSVSLSCEDRKFLEIMENNIVQLPNGRYQMPLPFKESSNKLFDNSDQVLKRTMLLKSRFSRDKLFHEEYCAFMSDMIERGYAEPVLQSELKQTRGIWYIPHFGIYHKVKKKLRVVFDCSAKYGGISLNDSLLQGPDLANLLVGVLCRFRKEPIAFTCDVEKMFYNFKVDPKDRDYLRFYWWPEGDYSKPIKVFRMTVHLFGAVSSPSCSTFAFRKIAQDREQEYGVEVCEFINRDFYVDDGLKSIESVEQACDLIKKARQVCQTSGVRLHKFVSNSKEVLATLPDEEKAEQMQKVNLELENPSVERVLGVEWCVSLDVFQFHVAVRQKPFTRRGVLSTIASVYDPLGFISPFVLVGKQILQRLCIQSYSWDDEVPVSMLCEWKRWLDELSNLNKVTIKRCIKPSHFNVYTVEFHHFCDASLLGYGVCSYVRFVSSEGNVSVSLVFAKSRVSPIKPVTVPRLELTAAVLAVRISLLIEKEFSYPDAKHFFWTDSKVVLGYITNESRRFHVFVSNRVGFIQSHTSVNQWHHVKGCFNVADIASRGMFPSQLIETEWFSGPEFLKALQLPLAFPKISISNEDPEVKESVVVHAAQSQVSSIVERFRYFSDFNRLRRAVALCLKYKLFLKLQASGLVTRSKALERPLAENISVSDLLEAEKEIVRLVQSDEFPQEKKILSESMGPFLDRDATVSRNRAIKRVSSLFRLDCYLDQAGLIRVGGRLKHANLPVDQIYPIVLPKSNHITRLLIDFYHQKVKHQGRLLTHNAVRAAGFWIINGSSEVYKVVNSCVMCKRLRSAMQTQKMADLPPDRVQEGAPFDCTGVDYFGPFIIKQGRKEVKRWGVIFTCMASRAVHLELAIDLSTSTFINVLRRFLAIRGPIAVLRCDQGTNFVGAKNELGALVKSNKTEISRYLQSENCSFEFKVNPPNASHMGGSWERLIRSVRSILQVLLAQNGSLIDEDSLRTFLFEIAAILNSRPLSVLTLNDPSSIEPLTPNHLLTLKSKVLLAPSSDFVKEDLFCVRRWRRVQYLVDEFWNRWKREYLSSLQSRAKWQKSQRNLSIGDIVIVEDESVPRNCWKLAKVVEVFPSKDGRVRSVKVMFGNSDLDKNGKSVNKLSYLVRPVNKLILLVECDPRLQE